MRTLKDKASRVSIQWNVLVKKPLVFSKGWFLRFWYSLIL